MDGKPLVGQAEVCQSRLASGRVEDAIRLSRQALAQVDGPHGDRDAFATLAAVLAESLVVAGHWDEADVVLSDARVRGLGDSHVIGHAVLAGTLGCRRGDLDMARRQLELAQEPLQAGEPDVPPSLLSMTLALESELLIAEDKPEDVGPALDVLWPMADRTASAELLWPDLILAGTARSMLASETGKGTSEPPSDDQTSPDLRRIATALPAQRPRHATERAHVAAELDFADGLRAPAAWEYVSERWRTFGDVYWSAIARVRQAECLVSEGNPAGASVALTEAHGVAAQLEARPLLDRVVTLARRHDVALNGL